MKISFSKLLIVEFAKYTFLVTHIVSNVTTRIQKFKVKVGIMGLDPPRLDFIGKKNHVATTDIQNLTHLSYGHRTVAGRYSRLRCTCRSESSENRCNCQSAVVPTLQDNSTDATGDVSVVASPLRYLCAVPGARGPLPESDPVSGRTIR